MTALTLLAGIGIDAPAAAQGVPGAIAPSGLQEAGRGRLRVWGFEVYDAALSVAPGFRPADFAAHAFVLELSYLRELRGADIARVSLEQMRKIGSFEPQQGQRWQALLEAMLPDVRRGDRLAGIHRPGRGAQFVLNGKPIGEIADPVFSRLFFGIWLAEATSEPALRQALLQGRTP